MLVMLSSVTTRKTPGMRMTHHELRRSARSANANMLPHESTSTGRPSPRKLKVASIAMLVLMLEMTTNMIADTKFGMRCLRMMKGNRAPMQREARMYSLLRICRTSLRTMRDRANQPVTPMTRAMVSSFGLPMRERISSRDRRTGTLCRSSTARIMALSTTPEATPDRQP